MAAVSGPALEVRVLGPLEVLVDGRLVRAGTPKLQLLLALLLARANRAVPVARLIDVLCDDAPFAARTSIQAYVSGIRRLTGDRISFGDGGYTCRIEPAESDLERFEQLTAAGRRALRAADREAVARSFADALRLWRGRAFADFAGLDWFAAESDRLQGRFLAAYEDWAEPEIELGRAAALLDSLDDLALRHPDRERLSACRMTALALCGLTSEALAHYDRLRQLPAREYGIEPSPVLAELHRALLSGGPDSAKPGTAAAVNGQGTRTATNTPAGLAPRSRTDAEAGTATASETDAPNGAAEAIVSPQDPAHVCRVRCGGSGLRAAPIFVFVYTRLGRA